MKKLAGTVGIVNTDLAPIMIGVQSSMNLFVKTIRFMTCVVIVGKKTSEKSDVFLPIFFGLFFTTIITIIFLEATLHNIDTFHYPSIILIRHFF